MNREQISTGGCQCGAVKYRVNGPLRDVVNCHCTECQRLNGNFGAHSKARTEHLDITETDGLQWYDIHPSVRRGFCKRCGSSLFWEAMQQPWTGIIAGSLDNGDALTTIGHIFVEEKAGFFEITDNLPQFRKSSDGKLPGDFV
ncbi:MAG: GFA family protein [Pseudomonadota bacterium]